MRRPLTLGCLVLTGLLANGAVVNPATAKEYNQRPFLAPSESSKVQRVISMGRAAQGHQFGLGNEAPNNPNASIVNTDCGKLAVGNVETTGRGQRAPRENIVIAREIINAPINCGTRARR